MSQDLVRARRGIGSGAKTHAEQAETALAAAVHENNDLRAENARLHAERKELDKQIGVERLNAWTEHRRAERYLAAIHRTRWYVRHPGNWSAHDGRRSTILSLLDPDGMHAGGTYVVIDAAADRVEEDGS